MELGGVEKSEMRKKDKRTRQMHTIQCAKGKYHKMGVVQLSGESLHLETKMLQLLRGGNRGNMEIREETRASDQTALSYDTNSGLRVCTKPHNAYARCPHCN